MSKYIGFTLTDGSRRLLLANDIVHMDMPAANTLVVSYTSSLINTGATASKRIQLQLSGNLNTRDLTIYNIMAALVGEALTNRDGVYNIPQIIPGLIDVSNNRVTINTISIL